MLFSEINAHFLVNERGDPSFLFCVFQENTTPHDISKFEEIFVTQL